ncbi:ZW10 interactor [Apodemus sylvaticus]|uniref:ZW10 interactor n=1 Tax=Apodemus sylvaticus TaxID=10129 RepID=UPI002243689E|nr:ZW10 interactor [Apodemus sylvaticus]XP_052019450.1 ZW10 interactor [Apodemus sylvaticus]XP_052019451.1 ZW10 interactor [Apodemus sylvaticus]
MADAEKKAISDAERKAIAEKIAATTKQVLDEAATTLEPAGFQEESELAAKIMEEFMKSSRKKDKLLCSQLQVVNFLQSFLAQEDNTDQNPDVLASEDESRQKATETKEQWKDMKATYMDHVDVIKCALSKALPQVKEAHKKYSELQNAFEQLETKKRVLEEKLQLAQKQWVMQQKRLQNLTKISSEVKRRRKRALEKLDGSHQELETLKHQAGQEKERLQRNQSYLQLLCSLQNKLVISETETEDKNAKGRALPPKSP